jgi:two-component system phosphate regulon sensor histidine kinase PhoR
MAHAGRFALMVWPWIRNSGNAPARPDTEPAPAGRLEDGAAAVLQAISATLPDPLLVLDAQGQVLLANPHAAEALDQDPSGKHISASVRSPAILDAVRDVLAGGEARRVDFERRVPVVRRFETFIAPVDLPRDADARGGPAVLIVMRDLTREQQLERMRADFVAHASHELRTPLAAVLGFIETLQGPARDDAPARARFLSLMQAQAERMRRLIDDLLSLSRIEMSVHERPVSIIDLAAVTRQAIDPLMPLARESGVAIELALPDSLPVRGDAEALTQVVQNLVENAIKYASTGKRIDVSLAAADDTAELSVRDYGPGIAPEHLPRLTERFYRVNVQESRSRGGTGLGLAIVKHILNRHRGRLAIQSGQGEGSTFTVRLPIAASRTASI